MATPEDPAATIFLAAKQREAASRAAYLDSVCAGDEALRSRVESLLIADGIEVAPGDPAAPTVVGDATGAVTRIGPYRILETLGEGGMGIVYHAEQTEPVTRRVALKVIKLGMDTKEVIARFEAERQALAMMEHPGVAKVFDAGITVTGRPYFVMELVKGLPITEYCDRHAMPTRERLAIFIAACTAVQHAHQKGIIHRDLKPSNVLVTEQDGHPVPKVIDFGVAKATGGQLTDRTMFTEQGRLIGTPEYMSPEQAEMSGLDIDTRTDIYSLGVLLYELLTGTLPHEPEALRADRGSIPRILRETDPPKPSTRLSDADSGAVARRRGCDPAALSRQLRGDLDWIIMRCLEKDRTRRYETPGALREDIERYLDDRPVVAGPPSTSYRMRKFVRRHRVGVGAGALVVLAIATGVVGLTWGLVRARAEWHRTQAALAEAKYQANVARAINEFVNDDMLAAVDPANTPNPEVTMREVLEAASANLAGRFTDAALVEAGIRHTIGSTFINLADYERAGEHLVQAHALRLASLGPDHADTLLSLRDLGILAYFRGDYETGESRLREATEALRAMRGPADQDVLRAQTDLAFVVMQQGRFDEAEAIFRDTLERQRGDGRRDDDDALMTAGNLAYLLMRLDRFDEAEPLYLEACGGLQQLFGDEHPRVLTCLNNLASMYNAAGRFADAEPILLRVLETQRRVLGDRHRQTLVTMNNVGFLYRKTQRFDEAEPLFVLAYDGRRETLGPEHPHTLASMSNLGQLYIAQGRLDEATLLLERGLEIARAASGPDHPDTLYAVSDLARLRAAQNRLEDAAALLEDLLARAPAVLGERHGLVLGGVVRLANVEFDRGRCDVAEPLLRRSIDELGDRAVPRALAQRRLGACLTADGRYEDAEAALVAAYEILAAAQHAETGLAVAGLVELYTRWDQPGEAASWRAKETPDG